jgi:hypothetical protein
MQNGAERKKEWKKLFNFFPLYFSVFSRRFAVVMSFLIKL